MASKNNFMLLTARDARFHANSDIMLFDDDQPSPILKRSEFPSDFVFGAATSAYQVEGAWNVQAKGMSNWDVFSQNQPGSIDDGSNGCTAIDQYNLFKEDVALMKKVGLDSYRFSISWTRILPGGRLSSGISQLGIKYYNDLIDALVAAGIEPCATLFHWDVPQCLELEYQGFLSDRIIEDFGEFAEVCFWNFGDRVKRWITLNEPWSFTVQGYVLGNFPPCRGNTASQKGPTAGLINFPIHRSRSGPRVNTTEGDPGTEPYNVAHHLILAHAYAVNIYRTKYQATQGGEIGMTNVASYFEPYNPTDEDREACSRALQFMIGWFVEPLVTGDYPQAMREIVKDRLPKFNDKVELPVKGSYDFLGINYYTSYYVKNLPPMPGIPERDIPYNYENDQHVLFYTERNGVPIGPKAGSDWLYVVPRGIFNLLVYAQATYNDPIIYITENGVDEKNDKSKNVTKSLDDEMRVNYHNDHLWYLKLAINRARVRLKGYYIWSLFDNFEWCEGYTVRFGIFYIDFDNGRLTRFPKRSAIWWMNFLDKKQIKKSQETEEGLEDNPMKRIRSN